MGRRALVVLFAVVVGACSGGGGATLAPGASGGTRTAAPSGPTLAPPSTGGGGGGLQRTLRPSGAKVRVVNLYRSGAGEPAALDIYGNFSAVPGLLVATVPFGTVSSWFDPGILDDQGNADITFYPAGRTAAGDRLGDQSETLKGNEQITIVIAAGENTSSSGTPFAHWRAIFETSADNPLATAPAAGTAVLFVDGLALAKTFPGSKDTFLYLGVDGTCLPSVEMGVKGGAQPTGPDTFAAFIVPAGAHDLTFHISNPDCAAKGTYDSLPLTLKPGDRSYLFFYTEDGKSLKELLLPVAP